MAIQFSYPGNRFEVQLERFSFATNDFVAKQVGNPQRQKKTRKYKLFERPKKFKAIPREIPKERKNGQTGHTFSHPQKIVASQ